MEAARRRPSCRSESRSLCDAVISGLLTSSPADNSFPCFPYGVLQQIPNDSLVDQMMNQLESHGKLRAYGQVFSLYQDPVADQKFSHKKDLEARLSGAQL